MKKIISLIFAALLPLMANAYDCIVDNIYYYILSESTAQVAPSSVIYGRYSGDISIPRTFVYDNVEYTVTSIGGYAFNDCFYLTSVSIPESVTTIGSYAFQYCRNLTSANIPNSVTSIGSHAFQECTKLTTIDIPSNVTYIGEYTFNECDGLTSVNIPYGVTEIGEGTFSGCSNLESVTIPNSVTNIGLCAFAWCMKLKSVIIPGSVTSIGKQAFDSCLQMTSVTIGDGVQNIGYGAFQECNALISVDIPNSVTSLDKYAFYSCDNLTSVIIGNGVNTICEEAFCGCFNLTSVIIPNSVTSIEGGAFYGCRSLTTIDSYINEPFVFGDWAFSGIGGEATLIVPQGTRDAYLAAGWTEDVFRGGVVERTGTNEVSISIADYATIYCPESDLTIPEGIQAFTGVIQGEWLSLNEVTGKIPAGTAVVLKGEEGTYSFTYTTGAEPVGENDLKGTAGPLVADGTQFILAKRESYGFFKATPGTTIPARKAYLETTAQNVKGFLFHEDDATSINEEFRMKNEESEADIYNLAGQRVNKAQKGIYIINGKKVLK